MKKTLKIIFFGALLALSCILCGCDESAEGVSSHNKCSYSQAIVPPSCETPGYTLYLCTECGDAYRDDEVAALGHSYVQTASNAATCTMDGKIVYTCSACSSVKEETTSSALGHQYSDWVLVQSPTESSTGLLQRNCANEPGVTEEYVLPLLDVSNGYTLNVIREATCKSTGAGEYSYTKDNTVFSFPIVLKKTACDFGSSAYCRYCKVKDPSFIEIDTVQELIDISNNLSGNYVLTADLDSWYPGYAIGTVDAPFTGIFDGNGHTIESIEYDTTFDEQILGVFGYNAGVVRNLNVGSVSYTLEYDVGRWYVTTENCQDIIGGIVAHNSGSVLNCTVEKIRYERHVSADMTSNGDDGSKDVTITGYIGGIVGFNTGTVADCGLKESCIYYGSNYLTVRREGWFSDACSFNAKVMDSFGGIVGYNSGEVVRCLLESFEPGGVYAYAGADNNNNVGTYLRHTINAKISVAGGAIVGSNSGTVSDSSLAIKLYKSENSSYESNQAYEEAIVKMSDDGLVGENVKGGNVKQ